MWATESVVHRISELLSLWSLWVGGTFGSTTPETPESSDPIGQEQNFGPQEFTQWSR